MGERRFGEASAVLTTKYVRVRGRFLTSIFSKIARVGLTEWLAGTLSFCLYPTLSPWRSWESGPFMPRWLTALLFVLALAVQVSTPIANGVAAARGRDNHGLTEFCLKGAGETRDQGPVRHSHGRHDCGLCETFCDGVTPVVIRFSALAGASAHWVSVSWQTPDVGTTSRQRLSAHQARAPPLFS
jgi:hypothetical protein